MSSGYPLGKESLESNFYNVTSNENKSKANINCEVISNAVPSKSHVSQAKINFARTTLSYIIEKKMNNLCNKHVFS